MRITPKDTIAGIIEQNSALFGMGAARITEQLKNYQIAIAFSSSENFGLIAK